MTNDGDRPLATSAGIIEDPPPAVGRRPQSPVVVGLLLVGSGFCALVYQVAWFRLLRLVFGSSTAATGAVLAIFMGGLGLGGVLLGRRAQRSTNPLALYAWLEIAIASLAAASPLLVLVVRTAYVALGGSGTFGLAGATVLRLLLAALILGVPTTLMGGTLPAVSKAVERATDRGRRYVAWLYGLNALGGVVGVVLATFLLLELVGIRQTIWLASALNLLVGVGAYRLAHRDAGTEPDTAEAVADPAEDQAPGKADPPGEEPQELAPSWLVLPAAGVFGFLFFLMELVWYRMLAPLLGGSSYTFGLILGLALAGVGTGGLLYAAGPSRRRPTLLALATTAMLEALLLILPFVLGDHLAYFAVALRGLQAIGFEGLVIGWSIVAGLVVLPPALVAGYQFPLLIGLLGSGERRVASQVGLAYAWNTWGSILGSLAGGFGLLPLLTAPRLWRLSAWLLLGLGALTLVLTGLRRRALHRAWLPIAAGATAAALTLTATGPTAYWRHSPIGAGRVAPVESPNAWRQARNDRRAKIAWESEGLESSIAILQFDQPALLVNGKSDGSVRGDAATFVMSPLIGAVLHPDPRRILVIGLGTGMSAGWLSVVESAERVDIVEIEPAVADASPLFFEPFNLAALERPNVQLLIGDGREMVLTSDDEYDLVVSQPSNPYRAGVASLFSRDFYRGVERRLAPGGLFVQWLQGYDVDAAAVATSYATLHSVFPHIETWAPLAKDLALVASRERIPHDLERIAERVQSEPFKGALWEMWHVAGPEGFYSGFVADARLARWLGESDLARISTDDRPRIEFGFARNLGRAGLFDLRSIEQLARQLGADALPVANGQIDLALVEELRQVRRLLGTYPPGGRRTGDAEARERFAARSAYSHGRTAEGYRRWQRQGAPPSGDLDRLLLAEGAAEAGDPRALTLLEEIASPIQAERPAIRARLHWRRGEPEEAAERLVEAFAALRRDPWFFRPIIDRALKLSSTISASDPRLAVRLVEALGESFLGHLLEASRRETLWRIVRAGPLFRDHCVAALEPFEPHVPWERELLERRAFCYRLHAHPLAETARRELIELLADEPTPLEAHAPR